MTPIGKKHNEQKKDDHTDTAASSAVQRALAQETNSAIEETNLSSSFRRRSSSMRLSSPTIKASTSESSLVQENTLSRDKVDISHDFRRRSSSVRWKKPETTVKTSTSEERSVQNSSQDLDEVDFTSPFRSRSSPVLLTRPALALPKKPMLSTQTTRATAHASTAQIAALKIKRAKLQKQQETERCRLQQHMTQVTQSLQRIHTETHMMLLKSPQEARQEKNILIKDLCLNCRAEHTRIERLQNKNIHHKMEQCHQQWAKHLNTLKKAYESAATRVRKSYLVRIEQEKCYQTEMETEMNALAHAVRGYLKSQAQAELALIERCAEYLDTLCANSTAAKEYTKASEPLWNSLIAQYEERCLRALGLIHAQEEELLEKEAACTQRYRRVS